MMAGDDRTLDEVRLALAPEIARAAVFDGWTDQALGQAAALAGVDPAVARLAFPDGAMDMITAQMPAELKRARADYIIENTGTVRELEERVSEVWQALEREADARATTSAVS